VAAGRATSRAGWRAFAPERPISNTLICRTLAPPERMPQYGSLAFEDFLAHSRVGQEILDLARR